MASRPGRMQADPRDSVWDVAVIGTGAGGGTAGFNLARSGRSVLFIERGPMKHELVVQNPFAPPSISQNASGWWPHSVRRREDTDGSSQAWIGCGLGGSTAVFTMVMDRFRPADFTPRRFAPKSSAETLPEIWPIAYEELEPYYREAEALFRVRGTDDPLTPTGGQLLQPAAPSGAELALHIVLQQSGLHPYRLHSACERVPGCGSCLGRLCTRACRNDAGRMCVLPAIQRHGAHVLSDCRVLRLEAVGRTVHSAVCLWNGEQVEIRAKTFVLGLHSMLTPALLLRSANASFPDGLGNSSGTVGRYLMCHVADSLLLSFDEPHGFANELLNHGLSLNDFYLRDGAKLGNIHAHAADCAGFRDSLLPCDENGATALFHTIVEDFPHAENRVTPAADSDDGVCWQYELPDELRHRSRMLVDAFADAISERCRVKLLQPSCSLNIGHACGTCRFGDDPRTSVLDRDNRIHDLDNVYVVDASFFPSSGGINPCLTVVANSLRVSALVARR